MPLLLHFSKSDLNNLKSLDDYVFLYFPFYGLVAYPFEWNWAIFALCAVLLLIIVVYGFRKRQLSGPGLARGFIPPLALLLIAGLCGYYSWGTLKWLYPHYEDMLHGFTYNGHFYVAALVLLSMTVAFLLYHGFRKEKLVNLLLAPAIIWLIICGLLAHYLPGAAFFILPLFAYMAAYYIVLTQENPNLYLMLFLCLPALWIFSPFIKMLPVGLGLGMLITATLFTALLFVLTLPLVGFYVRKRRISYLTFVLFIGCLFAAHLNAGFNADNPKPTSLLYVLNADEGKANWATYEKEVSPWTAQYLDEERTPATTLAANTLSSKYSSGFTFVHPAPEKPIPAPLVERSRDTVIGDSRYLELCIMPQRDVNRLEVFSNDAEIEEMSINQIPLDEFYLSARRGGRLLTHYISNNDFTELSIKIPSDEKLVLELYEASNDLLEHPQFSIPERSAEYIPMPFVLNDAILVTKTLRFD